MQLVMTGFLYNFIQETIEKFLYRGMFQIIWGEPK